MIEVYTQPNCSQCDATQRWLARRGVPFVKHEVKEYRDFLALRLGVKQTPVVVVYKPNGAYDRHWTGHQTRQLETLTTDTEGVDALWEEGN